MNCTLAVTPEQHDLVYRLRYECYHRSGAIDALPEERFSDSFDRAPNNFSFLVTSPEREPLATVRISVVCPRLGWTDSPALHVYGDHPALHSISRESFVEASRLCFQPQARRDAFIRLVAHMAALADLYDVGWLVACPRVEHVATYERSFGFKSLAEPRKYFGVSFYTQLLGIRRSRLQQHVQGNAFMIAAWQNALHRLTVAHALVRAASPLMATPVLTAPPPSLTHAAQA